MGAFVAVCLVAFVLFLAGNAVGWGWFLLSAALFGLAWWVHDKLNSPALSGLLVMISILIFLAQFVDMF